MWDAEQAEEWLAGWTEGWNAGDLDAIRPYYEDDAVMHHPPGWPEPGPSSGIEAIIAQFRDLLSSFPVQSLENELIEFADDRMIVRQHWLAQGSASGAETLTLWFAASRLSPERRIREIAFIPDLDDARAWLDSEGDPPPQ